MNQSARGPRPSWGDTLPTSPGDLLALMARLDAAIEPAVFEAPVKYSLRDVAIATGVPEEQVLTFSRWIGRPPSSPEDIRYTDSDVTAVSHAAHFQELTGLDNEAMGALVRGMAFAMERLATREVESMVQKVAARDQQGDTAARMSVAERAPALATELIPLLSHIYRRHYATAIRRLTLDAIAQRGINNNDSDYPLIRAIGFADLVNFTARTENMSAGEFNDLMRTFSATCWDIVNDNHGRVINFMGDAVFFVADTLQAGANIALSLAAPGALGACGPARVGLVWTRVTVTNGDVYGPGVNLASRISAAATPSEVFIGPKAAKMLSLSPRFEITPQPAIDAHGIGIVQVARLRYADDPRSEFD